jgi:4-amino-4-deoxy-L-arabinose transferase-like glycosyltransferase
MMRRAATHEAEDRDDAALLRRADNTPSSFPPANPTHDDDRARADAPRDDEELTRPDNDEARTRRDNEERARLAEDDHEPARRDDVEGRAQIDDARVPPDAEDGGALSGRLSAGEWRALSGWTAAAFGLRLLLLLSVGHVISPDGVNYVHMGRSLVAGNFAEGLSTYWPPLYPLLVGVSSLLFRDAEFAGRMVSVVAGSLLVLPVHRLVRRWYGRRAALVGACVVALHPVLVYYSTVLLTEATYTLLFTCGVLAGWSALSDGRGRAYVIAGATFGACYLLKPEAVAFLLLLLAPSLSAPLFDARRTFKTFTTSARNALLLGAGFLLLASPYLVYQRQQTGVWALSGKLGGHMWQGSRQAGDAVIPMGTLMPDATTALSQLARALRYEYELFNLVFPTAFVLLAGLGLFRRRWTKERVGRELYLFSFVGAALAGYAVTLPNIRFLVPLVPLLLCPVSQGIVDFDDWTVRTLVGSRRALRFLPRVRRAVVPLVVAVALASLLPLVVYLFKGDKWSDYEGQRHAALWIKEHDAGTPVIMSTVPVAAFYANGRHVPLLDETYESFITRARRERVAYVVVNERNVKTMELRPLLDADAQHSGLRLAHSLALAPEHRILVYRLAAENDGDAPPSQVQTP